MKTKSAFTVIELLVVLAVIIVLGLIVSTYRARRLFPETPTPAPTHYEPR